MREGLTGEERVLLYTTAIQTGLRAKELKTLTRGRLFLASEPPYITAKAKNTKNGRDARQYIRPELAAKLAVYATTKTPKAPVFQFPSLELAGRHAAGRIWRTPANNGYGPRSMIRESLPGVRKATF